jgi:uncharacterized membrane protein HdeD (DUF308 family)
MEKSLHLPPETSVPVDLAALELRSISWTLVLSGTISLVIGILAFVAPLPTVAALVLLFGVYALVDGVVNLVGAVGSLRRHVRAWPQVVRGLAGVLVGIFTFLAPPVTGVVLLVVIAVWAMMLGVLELITAVRLGRTTGRAWLFAVYGVISLAFGAFLLLTPAGVFAVAALIGTFALVRGVVAMWAGFSVRRAIVRA